ncbi:MAG: ABC transporter permease [Candidatus Geothermarchaeales archaeon]
MRLLDVLSSARIIRVLVYSSAVLFFFVLVFVPPLIGVLFKWDTLSQVFEDPSLMNRALSAILASFQIASLIAVIDLATGLPLAWFLARSKSKYMEILDTLVDMPLVMPTVALGYSLLLFWGGPGGISILTGKGLIGPGWILIAFLHLTFSYPYIVRTMVGAIKQYDVQYEMQARTLGASAFTTARTVTLPILKLEIIASLILAFARSLSETGATVMVAGAFETGPVFIKRAIDLGYEGSLVFAGLIMIFLSILVLGMLRVLGARLELPLRRVFPRFEKKLSESRIHDTGMFLSILFFLLMIIVPSFFVISPAIYAASDGTLEQAVRAVGLWRGYWDSFLLSFVVAGVVSIINVLLGLPMVIIVSRKKLGRFSTVLDALINVPIIVPTVALGVSLGLFWRELSVLPIEEFWILVLAHVSFTYPFFVKVMSAAVEGIDISLEDVARTLGARPFTVFRTLILPLTKYSLFSSIIMMFTRSIDETGATLAVAVRLKTVPVLLVEWVSYAERGMITLTQPALGAFILILFSFAVMLISRMFLKAHMS